MIELLFYVCTNTDGLAIGAVLKITKREIEMKIKNTCFTRKKHLAMVIPFLMAAQSHALLMDIGQIEVSFDSQFSLGSSWRTQGQDSSLLNYSAPATAVTDGSTSDDGNRNYKKGDAFSQIFKGSHDLQFNYENVGGFVRGKYWYDSALDNNSVEHGHGPTTASSGSFTGVNYADGSKLDDSNFNDLSKASGATILDAFVYGSFEIADMPLDVRLGKQVVSWGESTFISGGINAINPVDVSAFRRPGAEIKEGLLPVNMAYSSVGLTDNLSLETFYQLEFQETVTDACGTFFSTSDLSADGCDTLTVSGGALAITRNSEGGTRKASDDGQFGAALRYFSDELDTEFGFYAMNIHSRLPIYSTTVDVNPDQLVIDGTKQQVTTAILSSVAKDAEGNDIAGGATWAQIGVNETNLYDESSLGGAGLTATANSLVATNTGNALAATRSGSAGYYIEYPEDTQLYGISFSSNFAGVAVSGEVSHKINTPVQINGILATAVNLNNGVAVGGNAGTVAAYAEYFGDASKGDDIAGYRTFDITQAQITVINLWNQIAGASIVSLIGEVGVSHIHGFDDVLKYGRSSTYGAPKFDASDDGFVTQTSWGYRARLGAKYNNVISGVDFSPSLSWSHDVEGYAASPGGAFGEGQQSLGLSVQADYLSKYRATLAYKQFMGGDYNVVSDRDFASVSVDVQF